MNSIKQCYFAKIILRYVAAIFLIAGFSSNLAAQKDSVTKVFIIRHAEKAQEASQDPSLSAIGKSRAASLARLLDATPIHLIYSTPYKRTRETVGELSNKKGVSVENYDPMDVETVKLLVRNNKGKNLVFVGHSNTVPVILNALTQTTKYKNLPESEFDNLWILFLKGDELVDQLHLKY